MCEQAPGPMDHAKVERKSTVMYSTTGVKVTRPRTGSPVNGFVFEYCLTGRNNSAEVTVIC